VSAQLPGAVTADDFHRYSSLEALAGVLPDVGKQEAAADHDLPHEAGIMPLEVDTLPVGQQENAASGSRRAG
jgi:hypothetical protein